MGRRLALTTKPLPSYNRPRNGYQVPLWSTEGIHGLFHAVGSHDYPATGRLIKAMSSNCFFLKGRGMPRAFTMGIVVHGWSHFGQTCYQHLIMHGLPLSPHLLRE